MSEAQKLMAEVLEAHTPRTRRVNSELRPDVYFNRPACRGCDWIGEGFLGTAHRAHVAAEIDKALGVLERLNAGRLGVANPGRWISGWTV